MGKTVHFTPPKALPISAEERKRLLALSAANESDIDFSDIPASTDATWQGAVRGRFYRPVKQQVTLRLDSNTLDWFKRHLDSRPCDRGRPRRHSPIPPLRVDRHARD